MIWTLFSQLVEQTEIVQSKRQTKGNQLTKPICIKIGGFIAGCKETLVHFMLGTMMD